MSGFARTISFLLAGFLILDSRGCSALEDQEDTKWWETTLVYQIWPRSYQDSDGDGDGDIKGIINRLDYINDLGVGTICLYPIYPSPLDDSGYDVSDFKNIHPIFGDLKDFDRLIEESHERDISVILDIIPNHSSDRHKWFNASVHSIEPYTDYYIWANGTVDENGTNLPPNNWMGAWADPLSSSWTWNDERGQWYYHQFHKTEPDLNLDNPEVRDEIMSVLEFWLAREVDGFRICGIPYFFEDPELRNVSSLLDTNFTFGLPKSVEFLYDIRKFVDDWTESHNSTPKYLTSETYDTDSNLLSYYGNDNASGIVPFNYRFIANICSGANATKVETEIEEWLHKIPSNASTNWALLNMDDWRKTGTDRLDAFHMLSMLLPGQTFTYYGDEIGMSPDDYFDDDGFPIKTLMKWNDTDKAGFSTTLSPYLPSRAKYVDNNVQEQLNDPRSHLNVYKKLARLRKDPVFTHGDWELESLNDDDVLVLRRTLTDYPVYLVVINLSDDEQTVNITELYPDLDEYLDVVVASGSDDMERTTVDRNHFGILESTGLVLRSGQNDGWKSMEFTLGSNEENEKEINETETTTVTTEEIETTTNYFLNETETTTDSSSDVVMSTTTQISITSTATPETETSSSSDSDSLLASVTLNSSLLLAIVIVARSW